MADRREQASEPRGLDEHAVAIEANVERIVRLSLTSAQHMAAKLNGPVYLIGSALHHPSPRDCDIRVVVPDHEFGARFGMEMKPTEREGWTKCIAWDEDGPTQRWIDDCGKTGAEWSVRLNLNVDYKVWPKSYWRERLYPVPLLLASPSPHWFVYNKHVPDPSAQSPHGGPGT